MLCLKAYTIYQKMNITQSVDKTYTKKYGQPQGNELVYGCDIIRRLDTFEFSLIDRFKSSRAAHIAYSEWMKESESKQKKC
jgi:hypothetical protein